jgi:hypothetical protein
MGFAPLMLAGSALSAAGQVAGGIGANRAAGINADNQEKQADQVETQTSANVAASRRTFDKFRGAFRADVAAYGGSAKRGTGLLMAQEAEKAAKLDELNLIVDGKNQAQAIRAGAAMTRYEGKLARNNAIMGGLGTAIKGFADYKSMRG